MKKNEALRSLRAALVYLYDNPASIRLVTDDAGLAISRIIWQGSTEQIWYEVLQEAERANKIEPLIGEARKSYPNNKALSDAYQAYLLAMGFEMDEAHEQDTATDRATTIINTGGGTYVAGDVNTGGGDFVGRDKKTGKKEN